MEPFCATHQQQIASMAFSYSAQVLATCSWDSTCMLWRVCEGANSADSASAATVLHLELVQIFPVHELGASCVRFTVDDQQLITTGDCAIKHWDVAKDTATLSIPSDSPDQGAQAELQGEKLRNLEAERVEWEAAVPFSLSVKRSMDLLAFDDTLRELVSHHEWQNYRSRDSSEQVLRLLSPEQEPISQSARCKTVKVIDTSSEEEPQGHALSPTLGLTRDSSEDSPSTVQIADRTNQDGGSLKDDAQVVSKADDISVNESIESAIRLEGETPSNVPEVLNVLSSEDAAYLEAYYRDLASFDFEQLLNPTLPLRSHSSIDDNANEDKIEDSTGGGKENQRQADTNASQSLPVEYDSNEENRDSDKENRGEASIKQPSTPVSRPPTHHKEIVWSPLQPDANGKLLQTFSEYNAQGIFSAHTSQITCCALATELDVLVTVALDKMLKFWSLASGDVLETVREAHAAPITCCALTSQKSTQNPNGVLVATGGKDNLIKVWRRSSRQSATTTELIYSFSGHYDSPTSCLFDDTGVFLITTGNDTNVIAWRVVPSIPDQPSVLRLTLVDKFAITVAWDAPLANGSPLLHYVIRTSQMSSLIVGGYDMRAVPDTHVPAKYTSKTIENLQPGIQYMLQIAAVNAIGSSPFSELTAPIETLAFVPSHVEPPLQYSECEATRLRLTWKQPSPNGALIQAFTIRCQPENSVFVPVLELSIPVAELEVMVGLLSGFADDKAHAKKRVTTTKKPTKLSTSKTKVIMMPVSSVASSPPPADVFYSFVVQGLWPGEIYQFVAAAENRCGLGAFSRVSDYVKMEPTAPDPPDKPLIVNIQKRQVDVEWEKPKSNGSEILQYTLEWVQDDSLAPQNGTEAIGSEVNTGEGKPVAIAELPLVRNSVVLLTRSIPGTNYTLQGLDPGKPLCVWLSASNLIANKICTSEFSPASDVAVTLCDVPDKPARPDLVQLSSHTLMLSFTSPKCNGLEILSYDVLLYYEEVQFGITSRQVFREFKLPATDCVAEDPRDIGGRCSFTIPTLRGKMYYSVKLCAINALGASLMSECSALVSTKPPTVPARMLEPPVIVGIEPTKASISWGLPDHDGGAPLIAFHVQYSAQPSSTCPLDEDDTDFDQTTTYKALFVEEVTIYQGRELLATFLKPKTTYRFRVASSNVVGKSAFSKKSAFVHTPSLVDFTISQYFAERPQAEHVKARFIQVRDAAVRFRVVVQLELSVS